MHTVTGNKVLLNLPTYVLYMADGHEILLQAYTYDHQLFVCTIIIKIYSYMLYSLRLKILVGLILCFKFYSHANKIFLVRGRP